MYLQTIQVNEKKIKLIALTNVMLLVELRWAWGLGLYKPPYRLKRSRYYSIIQTYTGDAWDDVTFFMFLACPNACNL